MRARARALRQGGAWYKGFWRGAKWFESGPLRTQGISRRQKLQSEPRAWNVVTWNASGLTVATFQELETLLRRDKIDIAFIQAYGKRYGEQAQTELVAVSQGTKEHGTFAIDATALEAQLAKLNPRKAVPKGTTPAVVWKACSQIVAGPVAAQFNHIWQDWRPIGLQDPLGKCVMGLVVAQARAAIVQLVMRYPQCIALMCGENVNVPESPSTNSTKASDLYNARAAALDQAGVNILVQEVIITWLTQVRYLFNRRGHQGVVKPKWGLRQGCKASPCLWAAYTALLCATLDHELAEQHVHMPHLDPSPWTRQHITKYADDTHARWRFTTYQEFEGVMQEVLVMLRCFRRFHMRVNLEKTKAVLKVVGSLKHRVKQNFIRKFKDSRRLLLSPKNPDHWLTLVSSTEYLGAVVSYDQYELQTMRHRIQKANNRRWALASFLHSRRISISLKLRIWRSCVLTTLMYGMASCGLTGDALLEVQRAIMRHVRAIVSNQAHLTGDTHQAIVTKYNIPSAKDLCEIEYQRAQDRQQSSPDWMFDEQWHLHLWSVELLRRVPPATIVMLGSRMDPTELDEFFGSLKQPAAQNKRRRSVDQQLVHPRNHHGSDNLVLTLAKVVVRQEEEIKILKQDHSIVMWMKPGEESILHHLYQVAKAYKQKLQENPQWSPDRKPPRTVLAIAVFRELAERLQKVLNNEDLLKKASDMGWRDASTGWDPSFRPDAVADLNGPATIPGRGHGDEVCIRKLTETMQGVATFLMDISVRSQAAQESWTHILSLQGNTVLQLIGLAYRRETLQCGPMVNQLKEMIRGR
ncbi:unnamed protein product [Symbiodinium sp. KB8]|nr:unnamed protein product [Symbiodinium sp. KB8]